MAVEASQSQVDLARQLEDLIRQIKKETALHEKVAAAAAAIRDALARFDVARDDAHSVTSNAFARLLHDQAECFTALEDVHRATLAQCATLAEACGVQGDLRYKDLIAAIETQPPDVRAACRASARELRASWADLTDALDLSRSEHDEVIADMRRGAGLITEAIATVQRGREASSGYAQMGRHLREASGFVNRKS